MIRHKLAACGYGGSGRDDEIVLAVQAKVKMGKGGLAKDKSRKSATSAFSFRSNFLRTRQTRVVESNVMIVRTTTSPKLPAWARERRRHRSA
jgi:hypothetical protein